MLKKTRLAVRSLLTMSNLFENLAEVYGGREAMSLVEPLGYRLFPAVRPSFRDCLHFTNLAAEALIRDLDLKKGQRALLVTPRGEELLLASAALIKAGGIAVPAAAGLGVGELLGRARGCGASLALVDAALLAARPDLLEGMAGSMDIMALGPRAAAPRGVPCLDEAVESSSGFFLPYTLKPANVAFLFHAEAGEGGLKAVMVTNQGLLGPQLRAAMFMPSRPGDLCLHALGLEGAQGMYAAVLGLCMGLRMRFLPAVGAAGLARELGAHSPAVLMAGSEECRELLRESGGGILSRLRLCVSLGDPLPRMLPAALLRPPRGRPASCLRGFLEVYGAGGRATAIALKPALPFAAWPEGCPGLPFPPNRMKVVGARGRRGKGGEDGELYVRGPAVTPGYWNDLEGTMDARRDGWFSAGVGASRKRFLVTLR